MPYKTDDKGNIVAIDGKPVFIKDDGTEAPVDFQSLVTEINSTRSESKARKEKLRALESTLEKFKDFGDVEPDYIRKAIDTMRNLDQKELIKAGDMDSAIKQAIENTEKKYQPVLTGYEKKMKELTDELESKRSMIHQQIVNHALSNSPFLNKQTNLTPDVRQAIFGSRFRTEEINGQLRPVAYKEDGERLYSPSNPAQLCDIEEAIQIIWNQYPYKDTYSSVRNSGSGSIGNQTGIAANNVYSRSEWAKKLQTASPMERAELAKQVTSGAIKIQ